MRLNRVFAYLFGCVTLVASVFVYLEYVYQLGFPDGFITELGFGERRLAYIFIVTSFVFAVYFVYFGWTGSRMKIGGKLYAGVIVYFIFISILLFIDYYYRQNLVNGGGG